MDPKLVARLDDVALGLALAALGISCVAFETRLEHGFVASQFFALLSVGAACVSAIGASGRKRSARVRSFVLAAASTVPFLAAVWTTHETEALFYAPVLGAIALAALLRAGGTGWLRGTTTLLALAATSAHASAIAAQVGDDPHGYLHPGTFYLRATATYGEGALVRAGMLATFALAFAALLADAARRGRPRMPAMLGLLATTTMAMSSLAASMALRAVLHGDADLANTIGVLAAGTELGGVGATAITIAWGIAAALDGGCPGLRARTVLATTAVPLLALGFAAAGDVWMGDESRLPQDPARLRSIAATWDLRRASGPLDRADHDDTELAIVDVVVARDGAIWSVDERAPRPWSPDDPPHPTWGSGSPRSLHVWAHPDAPPTSLAALARYTDLTLVAPATVALDVAPEVRARWPAIDCAAIVFVTRPLSFERATELGAMAAPPPPSGPPTELVAPDGATFPPAWPAALLGPIALSIAIARTRWRLRRSSVTAGAYRHPAPAPSITRARRSLRALATSALVTALTAGVVLAFFATTVQLGIGLSSAW